MAEAGGGVSSDELTAAGGRAGGSAPLDLPPPVVVLAPARSCSSVFVAMLGCHPDLYGFPELKVFAHDTIGELLDAPVGLPSLQRNHPHPDSAPGLRRAVAELIFGGQNRGRLIRAGRWLTDRRDVRTRDVFTLLLRRVAPLTGVEKSPDTIFDEAGPRRALAWFPSSRFIHLVRHPVSFQQSMQRMLLLADHPEVCAKAWLSPHRRIAKFCAGLAPGQSMLVRAEDLLAASDSSLAAIARFLGVSDSPAALDCMRHPERSPFSLTGEPEPGAYWDPGFLASPALRPPVVPNNLRVPPEWGIPEPLNDEIVALAESLGYR